MVFQAHFYQTNWEVLGGQVFHLIRSIFEGGESASVINSTFIVLIPKVPHPETIHYLRPISLCNVSDRIVTKLTANRFCTLLPNLVAPNRVS